MVNTDQVRIPVDIELKDPAIIAAMQRIRKTVEQQLRNISIGSLSGQLPLIRPTVTSRETVESQGKKLQITTRAKSTPELVRTETGEVAIANVTKLVTDIKELKEKINKEINLDTKRFNDFKKSIKFQPLEIQQSSLREFLAESARLEQSVSKLLPSDQFRIIRERIEQSKVLKPKHRQELLDEVARFQKSIENLPSNEQVGSIKQFVNKFKDFRKNFKLQAFELNENQVREFQAEADALEKAVNNLLPADQIRQVRSFIEKSTTFRPRVRKAFITELAAFEKSIQNLSSDDQQAAIKDFVKRFGDQNNELRTKLDSVTNKLRRTRFEQLKVDSLKLPIDERIRVFQDWIDSGKKFSDEAAKEIVKARQEQARTETRRVKLSFVRLKADERIKAIEELVAKGNIDVDEANNLIARERQRIQRTAVRDLKLDLKQLKADARIPAIQKVLDAGNLTIEEANRLMSQQSKEIDKIALKDLKADLVKLSPDDRVKAIEEFIKKNNTQVTEANKLLIQEKERIKKTAIKRLKVDFPDMKPDQRIAAIEEQIKKNNIDIETGNELIKKEVRNLRKEAQRKLKLDFVRMNPDERIKALEEAVKNNNFDIDQVNVLIHKEKEAIKRREVKKLKLRLSELAPDQRIPEIQKQLDLGNLEIEEANRLIRKENFNVKKEQFKQLKIDLADKPIEIQIQGYKDYIDAGGHFVDRANAEIRKLDKNFKSATKSLNKQRFTSFSKRLQTIDPQEAIKLLNDYIDNRTGEFVNDAKLLRSRIQRQLNNAAQQAKQNRQRSFQNLALLGSGGILGLLGPAGFPALNVGFAAMSGGPVGAGIVGTLTALGEMSRAFNRFKDNAVSVAKEINFVSNEFKNAEARAKGASGFFGGNALNVQRVGIEERTKLLKEASNDVTRMVNFFQTSIEAAKTIFTERITRSPFGETGTGKERSAIQIFRDIFNENSRTFRSNLQESLRNAQNAIRPTVGIENDPFQTWVRIQNSAFDPTKQQEMRQQEELIKTIKELIQKFDDANRRSGGASGSWGSGGASGSWGPTPSARDN